MSAVASTVPAKAASSIPAPIAAPCRCACIRGLSLLISDAAFRVERMAWAAAGSPVRPNSDRSPPLQKLGPRPQRWIAATESSEHATARAATRSSRILAL